MTEIDEDAPRAFEEMAEDAEESGLCDYCPLPDGAKGTHLYPTGHYSCEGSRCKEAYERYLEEIADD